VLIPLLVLGVPLFDTLSVIFLRLRSGQPIMRGDQRHFSHRLVALGMSPTMAVLFIYVVTMVTGMGAIMLGQLSLWGALWCLLQMVGIFTIIAILEVVAKRLNQ